MANKYVVFYCNRLISDNDLKYALESLDQLSSDRYKIASDFLTKDFDDNEKIKRDSYYNLLNWQNRAQLLEQKRTRSKNTKTKPNGRRVRVNKIKIWEEH